MMVRRLFAGNEIDGTAVDGNIVALLVILPSAVSVPLLVTLFAVIVPAVVRFPAVSVPLLVTLFAVIVPVLVIVPFDGVTIRPELFT